MDDFKLLSTELRSKAEKCVQLIRRIIAECTLDGVAFSFNGGKDCTVLLHLIHVALSGLCEDKTKPLSNIKVINFETKDNFPEMEQFMRDMSDEYGCTIEHLSGDFKAALEPIVGKDKIQAIFMGQRRIDPAGDKIELVSPSDPGWPSFLRVNPILEWSYHEVWDFLRQLKIPYCCLYDQGYTSVGSKYNTAPNPELKMDGTYQPAWMLKDGAQERAGRGTKKS